MLQRFSTMHNVLVQSNLRLLSPERLLFWQHFAKLKIILPNSRSTFSALSCRMTAKKPSHAQKSWKNTSKSSKPGKPAPSTSPSAYQSFAQVMALRQSPTILYQAQSHSWYIVSCYVVGGFCFVWAGINFHNEYLYPLEGVPRFLSIIMGGVCLFMVAIGSWFMVRPMRIVQTINALPSTWKPGSRALQLQIERADLLRRKKPSSLVVAAEDVTLSSPMFQNDDRLSEAEILEIRWRQNQIKESNKTRIMTAPFRHANYFMWRALRGAKAFFSNEGFIYMRVNGKNGVWKINRSAAWSLENGKALDRLVKHDL